MTELELQAELCTTSTWHLRDLRALGPSVELARPGGLMSIFIQIMHHVREWLRRLRAQLTW